MATARSGAPGATGSSGSRRRSGIPAQVIDWLWTTNEKSVGGAAVALIVAVAVTPWLARLGVVAIGASRLVAAALLGLIQLAVVEVPRAVRRRRRASA